MTTSKRRAPARENVHFPVRVVLQHLLDNYGAAGVDDAVVLRQHDAELGVLLERIADHFLIAVLEDVQRQMGAREDHHVQREQGKKPRGHATIIASQAGRGKPSLQTGKCKSTAKWSNHRSFRGHRRGLRGGIPKARRAALADRTVGREATRGGRSGCAGDRRRSDGAGNPGGGRGALHWSASAPSTSSINNAGMGSYDPAWKTPLADAARLVRVEFLRAARHDAARGAAHAREGRRSDRERFVHSGKGHAAVAYALFRLQVRAMLAHRRPAHGVEKGRHPHHDGLSRIRENEFPGARAGRGAAA